eukprot:717696-Amphidinium_carterae.1
MSTWKAKIDSAQPCGVPRSMILLGDRTPACFHASLLWRHAAASDGNALLRSIMATYTAPEEATLAFSPASMLRTSVRANLPALKADWDGWSTASHHGCMCRKRIPLQRRWMVERTVIGRTAPGLAT